MAKSCPHCITSEFSPRFVRSGSFYRKSDSTQVQRYYCLNCEKTFSSATSNPCYRQKKRRKNFQILQHICSGESQRRIAKILHLSRKTVARKVLFLAKQAQRSLEEQLLRIGTVTDLQFDDLETFEHTKCKPLSVALAVQTNTRFVLGFEVASMPAKGLLAAVARKKYGYRADERSLAREKLFIRLKEFVHPYANMLSDDNPHYTSVVKKVFPQANHETVKGKRGCVTGQGELKKVAYDPLFSLNHTCAMFRANVNRLIRKTWCTTKKVESLVAHLQIFSVYHNQIIFEQLARKQKKQSLELAS